MEVINMIIAWLALIFILGLFTIFIIVAGILAIPFVVIITILCMIAVITDGGS